MVFMNVFAEPYPKPGLFGPGAKIHRAARQFNVFPRRLDFVAVPDVGVRRENKEQDGFRIG
jgi:hypothetical protein